MHTQLESIIGEFDSAGARLRALVLEAPAEYWPHRPAPTRWSIAECIAHLNLTSAACVPLLRNGIAEARGLEGSAPRRYRRDLIGWFLWKTSGPNSRFRVKTTPSFVPTATAAPDQLIADFERLQAQQVACVREAAGLRIDRVKIRSPFDTRLKYNLYACLTILPRHQHRHLWQAEQVWQALRNRAFPTGG